MEFKKFSSIQRTVHKNPFSVSVTEKINGTNVCICINDTDIQAQSKKRVIELNEKGDNDHFGFAQWVQENKADLLKLGDGHHFGEWAGPGIEKNPHQLKQRELFLFNIARWEDSEVRPNCCSVVPLIGKGLLNTFRNIPDIDRSTSIGYASNAVECLFNPFSWQVVSDYLKTKKDQGQLSEGVIIYWHFFDKFTKHTIKTPKGKWLK